MRWTVQPPFIRLRLRRLALRYAAHGWPVTPGARLSHGRFVCDRPGCPTSSCHPALESWDSAATDDRSRIAAWWDREPHAVLLATGRDFDVLELPARLGLRVLCTIRLRGGAAAPGQGQVRGPVAVTPTGRWMFLVRPGDPLRPELEESLDVVRHGTGSWIPAPPTRLPEGAVRWVVAPDETRWRLPDPYALQQIVLDARAAGAPVTQREFERPEPAITTVPRQVSTIRRAG